MKLLLAFCLVASVLSATCPKYDCGSLSSGVCATFDNDNTTVKVNDNACPNNRICSINSIVAFAATNLTALEEESQGNTTLGGDSSNATQPTFVMPVLNCSQEAFDTNKTHGSKTVVCSDLNKTASFKSGNNPKKCTTEQDCLLTDNKTTGCLCGFDGHSYCKPPMNSSLFNFLEENCQANNGTINDTSVETYASLLLDYYPYVQNIPNCINNILEVAVIDELSSTVPGVSESPITDDSSGAMALLVSGMLFIAL